MVRSNKYENLSQSLYFKGNKDFLYRLFPFLKTPIL
jgi:hypothetical protein